MTMDEIVKRVYFMLGSPKGPDCNDENIKQAVLIAFQDLKTYMKTPVNKTVPYAKRLDLVKLGINTVKVLYVQAAYPRIGLTLSSLDAGNVFQVAAAANVYSQIGNTATLNIDPLVTEMAMAQVRNTITTDFQWNYDITNQCIYCTHRDPVPAMVTIRYVPNFQDVSEILSETWINYLIRLSEAYMKLHLGRKKSKYTVEGSNVSLDGEILLNEANTQLDALHEELKGKKNRLVVLN